MYRRRAGDSTSRGERPWKTLQPDPLRGRSSAPSARATTTCASPPDTAISALLAAIAIAAIVLWLDLIEPRPQSKASLRRLANGDSQFLFEKCRRNLLRDLPKELKVAATWRLQPGLGPSRVFASAEVPFSVDSQFRYREVEGDFEVMLTNPAAPAREKERPVIFLHIREVFKSTTARTLCIGAPHRRAANERSSAAQCDRRSTRACSAYRKRSRACPAAAASRDF